MTTHVRRVALVDGAVDATWALELCEGCGANANHQFPDNAAADADRKHRQASDAFIESIREEIATARLNGDEEALAAAAGFLAFLRPELADDLPPDLAELIAAYTPPKE